MKKVSIIISHFRTFRWTAICLHHFKKYTPPVDFEIIVCDNSPDHPSINAIKSTSLGDGVTFITGEKDFPSHGRGYDLSLKESTGDYIFCAETDSFPTMHGWFNEYIKASVDYDLIGPDVPQSSGRYIHPAGALINRTVIDAAEKWQKEHADWLFVPSAGMKLEVSDKCYHVVARKDYMKPFMRDASIKSESDLWSRCGVFQEMRSFDEDSFDTYSQRTGITNWEPIEGKDAYLKIGYEPGQWLSYFASSHGFRVLAAPSHIEWMSGKEGRQAAYSTVFDGFRHVWCGTSAFMNGIEPEVREFKMNQMNEYWNSIPAEIRSVIESYESTHDQQ